MTCKKCGSNQIKKTYVDRKHESLEGPDHLACECVECGYEWAAECRDTDILKAIKNMPNHVGVIEDSGKTTDTRIERILLQFFTK